MSDEDSFLKLLAQARAKVKLPTRMWKNGG